MEWELSSRPPPAPSRYVITTGPAVSLGESVTLGNQAQLQASMSCIPGDKEFSLQQSGKNWHAIVV